MIDTHCHLDYLEDPLQALNELGLTHVVAIGADPEHARKVIALSEQDARISTVVGLHPTDALQDTPEVRTDLEELGRHPSVVGVGETGLDYYWDAAPKEVQIAAFEWQLDWARRTSRPVIIHTRDKQNREQASLDCAEVLKNAGWNQGILHCCNGHMGLIEAGLELGFHVSFAGNVTYKNAHELREAAKAVPLDRILVETDAPFLAPMPHRGKSNRPGYTRYTLQFLAELLDLSEAAFEQITVQNARRVYQIQ
ncbi:TatD family hydrolase [Deinococcus roseus]|uniref:Deoxyribonuclease n=1 Tax=Deinococcus roseus TaxID=392414 RepID=A0ABQ2CWR6_9DEIO|nr:TatD family hydrolase [Deinococcus roseus]GGJ21340.1 deoxyribonuclease [Deinococcus roseus]